MHCAAADIREFSQPLLSIGVLGALTAPRDVASDKDAVDWAALAREAPNISDELVPIVRVVIPTRVISAEMDVAQVEQACWHVALGAERRTRPYRGARQLPALNESAGSAPERSTISAASS
jgi:hypothetical protein